MLKVKAFFSLFPALCVLLHHEALAQNIVSNGGFEIHNICPDNYGRIDYANGWTSANTGTPDFFDSCSNFRVTIPSNDFGIQTTHSGRAYAGFGYIANAPSVHYSEYLQTKLLHTLVKGNSYYFSMYVSLGESSGMATNKIGAYFSKQNISATNTQYFSNDTPQFITTSFVSDKTSWTKIQGIFTSSGDEQYLTIGKFDSSSASLIHVSGTWSVSNSPNGSYYFVDDVYLVDTCLLSTGQANLLMNDTSVCTNHISFHLQAKNSLDAPGYLWNTNDTTSFIDIKEPGTYWVRMSSGPCTFKDTVTISDKSVSVSLGPDTFLCGANSITFAPDHHPGDHFLWQNNSSDTFLQVNYPGSYSVRVSNTYCSNTDTVKLIYAIPPNVLGGDVHSCNNAVFPLKLSATAANADHYQWNNNSVDSFIMVNDTGLFWVLMNKNSCVVNDSIRVTNVNIAKPDLGPDTALCIGPNLILNANMTADAYKWYYNNSFLGSSLSPSLSVNNGGFYMVEANKANCKERDTILVAFKSKPQVSLGNDTLLCYNTTLTLVPNTNINGLTYRWQNGDTLSHYNVTSAGMYWIEANNGGCKNADSVTVNYENQIKVDLGNDTAVCQGQVLHLSPQLTGGATDFLWNTNAVTNAINISSAGLYWNQVSKGYCKARDTINVSFTQNPVVNIGNDTTVCANIVLNLKASNTNATFLWNTGETTNNINTTTQGLYWVKVTQNLCSSYDTFNLYTVTPPSLSIGNDTMLCGGTTLTLNAFIFGATYLWQDGSKASTFKVTNEGKYLVQVSKGICKIKDSVFVSYAAQPGLIFGHDTEYCFNQPVLLSAASTFADTYLWQDGSTANSLIAYNPGLYWVTVTVNICSATDSITLKQETVPEVDLGADKKLCKEDSLTLTAGIDATNKYLWNDQTSSSIKKVKPPGLFSVFVTNSHGCYATDTIALDTFSPVVSLGPDTSFCNGNTFEINTDSVFKSYLWQDGSSAKSFVANQAGIYFVTVKDVNNCIATDSIKLSVNQKPVIYLIKQLTICEPDTFIKPEGNFISYLWQDGTTSASFHINDYGTYAVTVTDSNYCTNNASINVISNCAGTLFIPNAFTPNDDATNEIFYPVTKNVKSISWKLYNRWGELIFETDDMEQGWDGTFKNNKAPADMYAYMIHYVGMDGNTYKKSGTVTLLK